MTCVYCNNSKDLLTENLIPGIGFADLVSREALEVFRETFSVFIDRGYLRLVTEEEADCMDHGKIIKIKYCPMCGEELKNV